MKFLKKIKILIKLPKLIKNTHFAHCKFLLKKYKRNFMIKATKKQLQLKSGHNSQAQVAFRNNIYKNNVKHAYIFFINKILYLRFD